MTERIDGFENAIPEPVAKQTIIIPKGNAVTIQFATGTDVDGEQATVRVCCYNQCVDEPEKCEVEIVDTIGSGLFTFAFTPKTSTPYERGYRDGRAWRR